jgi:hypothetical protein
VTLPNWWRAKDGAKLGPPDCSDIVLSFDATTDLHPTSAATRTVTPHEGGPNIQSMAREVRILPARLGLAARASHDLKNAT